MRMGRKRRNKRRIRRRISMRRRRIMGRRRRSRFPKIRPENCVLPVVTQPIFQRTIIMLSPCVPYLF
jgi:hypothetical protein